MQSFISLSQSVLSMNGTVMPLIRAVERLDNIRNKEKLLCLVLLLLTLSSVVSFALTETCDRT